MRTRLWFRQLWAILLWPITWIPDLIADIVGELTPSTKMDVGGFTFNSPGPNSQKNDLNAAQLQWCDERLNGFKTMREQAARSRFNRGKDDTGIQALA